MAVPYGQSDQQVRQYSRHVPGSLQARGQPSKLVISRPPRCPMISAESSESRPGRYPVTTISDLEKGSLPMMVRMPEATTRPFSGRTGRLLLG
jgi:hypothetical protein